VTALIPLYGRAGDLRGHAIVDDAETADWLMAEAASRRRKAPTAGQEPAPWRLAAAGYAKCASGQRGRSVYMHRLLLGLADDDPRYGDHINGDRLDNRRSNLRVVTAATNPQNRSVEGFASPYRGVSRCPSTGRWRAGCNVGGVWTWFGTHDTEELAAVAAREARAVHQPFAVEERAPVAA
jgi:hypothetical protein